MVAVDEVKATSNLTEDDLDSYSQNEIFFYEPCGSGSGNGDIGVLEGKDNMERIWNWFVHAGIKGVSDNPAVIAGIMGNLKQESGYNPFASNGTYYGLYQEDAASMRKYVEDKVGPVQWGTSTDDAEKNSKAIAAELEWLQDHDDFKQFVKDLNAPNSKVGEAGARSYAELFLVRYERAVNGSDSIKDSGVYNYMKKMYGGKTYLYQQASNRRDYAAEVYKYAQNNNVGVTAGSDGAANSDITSSVHEKAWELADQPAHPNAERGPTNAYKAAILEVGGDKSSDKGCASVGKSCDMFVATVLKSSGVDKNVPFGPVSNQQKYFAQHPEIYTPVEGDPADESIYQPGDIRIRDGHVEIYGQRDGKGYILSASNCDRYAGYSSFFVEKGYNYKIYRTQGTPACITNNGGCEQNSMDVVGTALCLAWPLGTKHSVRAWKGGKPTENFKKALDTVFPGHGHTQWSSGASCDKAAATVIHYSGVDKKFKDELDAGLWAFANSKGNSKWEVIRSSSKSDLQPGDVPIRKGHVWIFLGKIGNKYYGAEGHYYGHGGEYLAVEDSTHTRFTRILRPKNAQNTTQITEEMLKNAGSDGVISASGGNCDNCSADSGGLKDGGMTLEEAREFMKDYRNEAKLGKTGDYKFQGALVIDSGCDGGTLNNCSAFSQWFVNKYTTAGPEVSIYQGSATVNKLLGLNKGFKDGGRVPAVYAIASMGPETGSADGWYNHTGVVLGIDQANNKLILGEASCSNGWTSKYPNANEHPLDRYTNGSSQYAPTYAYTDDILVKEGLK